MQKVILNDKKNEWSKIVYSKIYYQTVSKYLNMFWVIKSMIAMICNTHERQNMLEWHLASYYY